MDIKKANVNLLLAKLRAYLDSVPADKRKGKKYVEAQKALARLETIFAGQKGMLEMRLCRNTIPAM